MLAANLLQLRTRLEALGRTMRGQSDVWAAGMAEATRICIMTLDDAARLTAAYDARVTPEAAPRGDDARAAS